MATRPALGAAKNVVTIVQPYVPAYRVPLFDQLHVLFERDGLRLVVAHSTPTAMQASRSDSRAGAWSRELPLRALKIGRHALHYRPVAALARNSRIIVAELASTNLDVYGLAWRHQTPLVLWGHGRAYVTARNRIDEQLELWLARRADHLLLYTDNGADYLEQRGIPADRMTVVQNSTDTTGLRRAMAELTPAAIAEFRHKHAIDSSNVALFVGALDPSKQVDLLLAASERARERLPDFLLLIAGDGPLADHVRRRATKQKELRVFPYADSRALALLGAVADLCVVPGRVGLTAVDAMTLGLPVITTDWPYHAPERHYLESAFCWVSAQNPAEFATEIDRRLVDRASLCSASRAASLRSLAFSIEHMAAAMYAGIAIAIAQGA